MNFHLFQPVNEPNAWQWLNKEFRSAEKQISGVSWFKSQLVKC